MTDDQALRDAVLDLSQPLCVARTDAGLVLAGEEEPFDAYAPACPPENLGDPAFRSDHGVACAYAAGSMANGIASCALVEALGLVGLLAFFGAAGLALGEVEAAVDRLQRSLAGRPHGFNLIHSPGEPDLEAALVDLYLRRGVRHVEASAYLDLTPSVVRYRLSGARRDAGGGIVAANKVVAKVSRVEVATRFLSPAPDRLVAELVRQGQLTEDEARLAPELPLCDDLTAEADSGGHTDNRPAITLLPTMTALRDRLQARFGYPKPPRVGLAGGISTPAAAAAAFTMGAAYVVTGSVNQACVESGSSDAVRALLAQAEQADTAMAPAADMFEMGVKVQVLKRGTMFAMRAARLYEIYRAYAGLDDLPAAERAALEKGVFRAPLEEVWGQTRAFFLTRDPAQVTRAERDPKHRMALVFRWYLGLSSRWANAGEPGRQLDYQVWCGPAMGAFNEWARGSFLEDWRQRRVVTVARNLLYGAAVLTRLQMLRCQGIHVPAEWARVPPLTPEELDDRLA